MICEIYSVKDELSGHFHNPMFLASSEITEKEATRIFKSEVNNTSIWRDNPHDFTLYYLGAFDTETGNFNCEKKEIINGSAVKGEK